MSKELELLREVEQGVSAVLGTPALDSIEQDYGIRNELPDLLVGIKDHLADLERKVLADRRAVKKDPFFKPASILESELLRWAWAKEQFPKATALSSLIKLEEEVKEIATNLATGVKDPTEYADAIMCLFDSAARDGISAQDIKKAYAEKVQVNLTRKWKENGDGTYSHVK